MTTAYPVFIKQNGNDFLVFVPDLEIYTEGSSISDAIQMSRDAIGLKGIGLEDSNENIPAPSTGKEAHKIACDDADEDFDYSDGILTYVDVDFTAYRNRLRNRAVKKNCTIPYWLNEKAEELGINFSKVLQDALTEKVSMKL